MNRHRERTREHCTLWLQRTLSKSPRRQRLVALPIEPLVRLDHQATDGLRWLARKASDGPHGGLVGLAGGVESTLDSRGDGRLSAWSSVDSRERDVAGGRRQRGGLQLRLAGPDRGAGAARRRQGGARWLYGWRGRYQSEHGARGRGRAGEVRVCPSVPSADGTAPPWGGAVRIEEGS